MKKIFLTISSILSLIVLSTILTAWSSGDNASRSKHLAGPDPGFCGDPANGLKTCCDCHSDGSPTFTADMMTSDVPALGYKPDSTYNITATVSLTGYSKFGFQVSPQSATGAPQGTLVNTSTQTQITTAFGCQYILQNSTGNTGTGTKTWTFKWTAPHTLIGNVTLYGAFCAADGDGTDQGDNIFTTTLVLHPLGTGVNEISNDINVSVFPTIVNDQVHLSYNLNNSQAINISLIDATGKVCETLFDGRQNEGRQDLTLNMSSAHGNGVYFIRVNSQGFNTVKKIFIQN